jgi:aspartyl protease family protein
MLRKFLIVGISAGISASIPTIYQSNPDRFDAMLGAVFGETEPDRLQVAAIATSAPPKGETVALFGKKVRLDADDRGHFIADFRLNGRPVSALVDTGATLVAINASTARRIGIALQQQDFKYKVATANGSAKAAAAKIDRLQIGRILVDNVAAVVLEDKALDGALIGMSFLKRLAKFEVKDDALLMVQ